MGTEEALMKMMKRLCLKSSVKYCWLLDSCSILYPDHPPLRTYILSIVKVEVESGDVPG